MPPVDAPARGGRRARRPARLLAAVLLLAGLLLLAVAPAASARGGGTPNRGGGAQGAATLAQGGGGTVIDIAEADGVVDGQIAGFVEELLAGAAREGTGLVVLQLDVRGSIGGAAERIATAIRSSEVPVLTWVGPPGARATGAGLLIAQSGHVRAAAPGTLLGPASPLDLAAGERPGDRQRYEGIAGSPLLDRMLDGGAVAIAPAGGQRALPDGVALPPGVAPADVTVTGETEAVEAGTLDVTAPALSDVLLALDEREVTVGGAAAVGPGERTVVLDLDPLTALPRFNNPGLVRQVLHAVAHPTLAYLLLLGGALALLFEVFQPGFGVAGLAGAAMGALGGYGLVVLPARPLAVVAVLAGLLLLAADLALGRLGTLTIGGTAALAGGSWWLLPGPAPLAIPLWVVVPATLGVVVFFVGVMTTVLRAQGHQALAGAERVVGEEGVVRSMLNPEGHVFVGGALWRARAPDDAGRVPNGTRVRVLGLNDGLTLDVVPVDEGGSVPSGGPQRSSSAGR